MLSLTKSLKCKSKPYCNISRLKLTYCIRGGVQKILSPEHLNSYSQVVQWATVRLILILQCIIGLHSQNIDFINTFAKEDIPSRESVCVELPGYFNIDGGQCDYVLSLNKILYSQA